MFFFGLLGKKHKIFSTKKESGDENVYFFAGVFFEVEKKCFFL